MITSVGSMNGDDWEEYCQKLLRMKYSDYQEVPAQFGGDLGIEGFIRSGIVFQCYCPDEDLVGIDLYKKQRDKITRDINKLIKNATKISRLGAGTIRQWHFLTPSYNHKQLLSHCRDKEASVLSGGLPEVDPNFKIYLRTDDDYIPERQHLLNIGLHKVYPWASQLASEELDDLLNSENLIVLNIKEKLEILQLPSAQSEELVRQLVSGYSMGQNELEKLNERFPTTYQAVIQLKEAMEQQLGVRVLSAPGGHGGILKQTLDDYESHLKFDFSEALTGALIIRLSTEAISDWLGRCPLYFQGTGSN